MHQRSLPSVRREQYRRLRWAHNKKARQLSLTGFFKSAGKRIKNLAPTYSPTFYCSTSRYYRGALAGLTSLFGPDSYREGRGGTAVAYNKKAPRQMTKGFFKSAGKRIKNLAPTYSPTFYCSTIGSGGLNFSVRNGKRWTPPI